VSCIVVGGDVVLGPMPREVLERLAAVHLPTVWIRGNCDRLVVEAARGTLAETLPAPVRSLVEWTAAQLSPTQHEFLAQLPLTYRMEVAEFGPVHFCHATTRSDEEIFTPNTPEERTRAMFDGTEEGVVVCGHTHVQFRRQVGPWQLVNAGSVGMSTGAAEAHWLLLDTTVSWQQTPYDAGSAIAAMNSTSYPGAREFIEGYITHGPTPDAVWKALER
jgi:diadenosine tetraphosphatase ApaH/serine/threonine PP2A family protein phosphatase